MAAPAHDIKRGIGRPSFQSLALFLTVLAAAAIFFRGTAADLFTAWSEPEYSYGYFVPPVALAWAWVIYRERKPVFRPARAGVWVFAFALFMNLFGDMAANNWLNRASLALAPGGLVIAFMGYAAWRCFLPPLALLFFAVPLPPGLLAALTADMQLASTTLSAAGLDLLNIPVYRQGNIIDLGTFKLQVADACSGLRYLFPFLGFSYLFAFWFEKSLWKRAVLIAAAAPIALVMNSLRILAVGITVDRWGMAAADEILHAAEGWVVFVFCLFSLFLMSWMLGLIAPTKSQSATPPRSVESAAPTPPWAGILAILIIGIGAQIFLTARAVDLVPPHQPLADFPLHLDGWQGVAGRLPPDEVESLKFSDYFMADYRLDGGAPVNFYVAYYTSQRRDAAPHSPLVCLPGSGWEIATLDRHFALRDATGHSVLQVNRAIVRNGDTAELVYFWYRERGRDLTTAPQRKWYLFEDSLAEGRTDGALIRLAAPLATIGAMEEGDKALTDFTLKAAPLMGRFVPD